MDVNGIWSGLFAAIVVGALGRVLVRGYQPIGCLLTLLIGLVGALIGGAIGHSQHWGFWGTFALQVLIAACSCCRSASARATASGERGHQRRRARSGCAGSSPRARTSTPRRRTRSRPAPPWLRANMVASVDGAITGPTAVGRDLLAGRPLRVRGAAPSRPTSCWSGPGTARTEGYRPARLPIALVSARLDLDLASPLLSPGRAPHDRATAASVGAERLRPPPQVADVVVCGDALVDLAVAVDDAALRAATAGCCARAVRPCSAAWSAARPARRAVPDDLAGAGRRGASSGSSPGTPLPAAGGPRARPPARGRRLAVRSLPRRSAA